MKRLALIFCFISSYVSGQGLGDKIIIGELSGQGIVMTVCKVNLIQIANKEFFKSKSVVLDIQILKDSTFGDRQEQYYYLKFVTVKPHNNIVRWLRLNNKELFLENSTNPESYEFEDFYISCAGDSECHPRVFIVGNEYIWSCRREILCKYEENCSLTTSAF